MKLLRGVKALAMMAGVVVLGVMTAPMAHATVTVAISPGTTPYMFANSVLNFTATTSDGAGVTWSLATGSGQSKGSLSNKTTTSATYTAPSNITSVHTVTLTATSTDSSSTATATITLETATSVTKAPIAGLTAMGDDHWTNAGGLPNNNMNEIYTHPGVYAGAVINVLWSQLMVQNGAGQWVYDFSAIDGVKSPITGQDYSATGPDGLQGLAEIAAQSSGNPNIKAKIRLRVDGPPTAPGTPSYVLAYGKSPDGVTISSGGNQIGAYWAQDTQTALTALQTAMAAYYDANPELVEVTVASCSSLDGEPYIEAKDSTSLTNLAGETDSSTDGPYNDADRTACFEAAGNPYTVWTATAIDSDYNQFTDTNGCFPTYSSGCTNADASVPIAAMANLKSQFGARGSLANHDLPGNTYYPLGTKNGLGTFYPAIAGYGAPIEFQTTVGLNGETACEALQLGRQYNMSEMEIHQTEAAEDGGSGSSATVLDEGQLQELQTLMGDSMSTMLAYTCSSMNSL